MSRTLLPRFPVSSVRSMTATLARVSQRQIVLKQQGGFWLEVKRMSRRAFVLGGVGLLSYLYFETHSISVKRYTIVIPNLPSDFRSFTILHLSDLHSKEYGDSQSQLVDLVKKQNFDLVAITGDLVAKGNPEIGPAITLVSSLKPTPIFFVPGNHEWWTNYQIRSPLQSLGVQILENSSCKFHRGHSHIWILGVDDPYLGRDRLDTALVNVGSAPRILLAHAPNIFPSAVKSSIDLVLVGHTHGGQIRLPFLGAVVAPGQGFFPKFDYGMYSSGSTTMIVNGGLGESVLPVRFNNRPEIVLITLKSG